MSSNSSRNRTISPRSSSFLGELTNRFRLVGRLMMDSRVHPLAKLLPVGAVAYTIWPVDLPGPLDDATVLWLGTTLFVQLCPPDVVNEHLQDIRQRAQSAEQGQYTSPAGPDDDIIDGEFVETDFDDEKKSQSTSR